MGGAQDWCLQCGAGAPDSLAANTPSWRSAAAVLGAVAILVAGAATAAYAALSKSGTKPRPATTATVAQVPAPTPPAATAPSSLPPAPAKIGTPTTVKPLIPLAKPPKIPLIAATPRSSTPITPIPSVAPTTSTTTPKTTGTGGSGTKTEQPESILLDTNAAATYNPSNYAASNFGDPSLAIDGDTSTAWTALVDPAVAPKMADGLVIDLKSAQKVSALVLDTSTPGMTVQVDGSNATTLPASITDPAWAQLSGLVLEKKKHVRIPLRDSSKALRFVLLWISKVPAASVGTAEAPGHVSVAEIGLLPTKKQR
jgi:type II secretory pathway pseudopilin PulG